MDTGFKRNYNERETYKNYYASDQLMFPVPQSDSRLKNKSEVLVLKTKGFQQDPVAISIDYLKKNNLYQARINGLAYLVIAEKDGLAKVYEAKDIGFDKYKNGKLIDVTGEKWRITEEQLVSPSGKRLRRLLADNIFWFAWVNAFTETKLVH